MEILLPMQAGAIRLFLRAVTHVLTPEDLPAMPVNTSGTHQPVFREPIGDADPVTLAGRAEQAGSGAPSQLPRPKRTLLYQIVEKHYLAFVSRTAQQEPPRPEVVQKELEVFLRCGR